MQILQFNYSAEPLTKTGTFYYFCLAGPLFPKNTSRSG